KDLFCTLLREIRVLNLLPKIQISISDAYFSAVEFEVDFFNRIGQKRTLVTCHLPEVIHGSTIISNDTERPA
uniref:hypothetical protein n=1 Tax=Pseudomonas sp. RL_105y_Pfl1_103 TaxID=3088707 RepID=UPI0030DB1590